MADGVQVAQHTTRYREPDREPTSWVDQVRGPAMSLGTYSIPAGGVDDQVAHREDEVYVVVSGRAVLLVNGTPTPVSPGSAVYVPAGTDHRFTEIAEDLTVLVVFAPPYTGR